MVSNEVKERIIPKLKPCLNEDLWDQIDYMFEECYETEMDGFKMITLQPPYGCELIAGFQFYELTGCFYQMVRMKDIKQKGRKV